MDTVALFEHALTVVFGGFCGNGHIEIFMIKIPDIFEENQD